MRTFGLPGLLVGILFLAVSLGGCADSGEPASPRLERLEARLDRLDDRLTRAEDRLSTAVNATVTAPAPGSDAGPGIDRERVESAVRNMDPERRARLREQFGSLRKRMDKLREGADMDAEPGTPEFRRALVLRMMQQNSGGRLGSFGAEDEEVSRNDSESSDGDRDADSEEATPDE